jgi:hypothetical protein
MLTENEMDMIATKAVEKILLRMPEVIGNLMSHHAMVNKVNKEFYEKNPDLKNHKEVVVSVLQAYEGNNPSMKYEDLLSNALYDIRKKVNMIQSVNLDVVSQNPNRTVELNSTLSNNGAI